MVARLAGKVALITDAGSGIGAAAVRRFTEEGARVVVNDITDAGETVAVQVRAAGGEALFLRADVADAEQVAHLIAEVVERYGRLDVLHNNAFSNRMGTVGTLSPQAWQASLAVTLNGTFYGLHAALPLMARQGAGAVVNTASISGLAADYAMSAYNAAKAGVVNLTRAAAIEYARYGVRVNAVCPGPIATPPLERLLARTPAVREQLRRLCT